MRRFAELSLLCGVVLVVGSCVDPRGPVALPGAWQLVRIDSDEGAPWRFGDTATLHADALILDDRARVVHARRTARDAYPEIAIDKECRGSWEFGDDRLVFTLSTWCADGEFVVTWRGGPTMVRERQGQHWVYRKVGR